MPVTAGSDATVYVWCLCPAGTKARQTVASVLAVKGSVLPEIQMIVRLQRMETERFFSIRLQDGHTVITYYAFVIASLPNRLAKVAGFRWMTTE